MTAWRILASCVGVLVLASAASAQTVFLQEKNLKGSYFHIQLQMDLKGKLNIQKQDKTVSLEQQAAAQHDFLERVLTEGENGLISRTARYYQTARATINVNKNQSERNLPGERALVVAQRTRDGLITFAPRGALSREELDLLEHFDTLALPGLLPGKEVKVGETWKLHNAAAQGLCYFEGLTAQDLSAKLEEVKEQKATISITGTASGIFAGAAVKLKIKAAAVFDLSAGRIVALNWSQEDEREQGPASPAMNATVSLKLKRQPVVLVNELNDFALVPVPQTPEPPPAMTAISYTDARGRFHLTHDRSWLMVARTDQHLVLRLLDRGEFVAQVSITCWPKAQPGKHMSADEFREAMKETLGWEQEEEKEAGQVPADNGCWIYRLATSGKLNEQKIVQYFYLVAGPNGDQMVLAFTMTPAQVQKLGTRDLDLVRSLLLPGATKTAGAVSSEAP